MDGLGSHYWLVALNGGIAAVQDVLEVLFESELGVESNS